MSDTPLLQQKEERNAHQKRRGGSNRIERGGLRLGAGLRGAADGKSLGARTQQLGRILRYTRQDHGRLDHRASD